MLQRLQIYVNVTQANSKYFFQNKKRHPLKANVLTDREIFPEEHSQRSFSEGESANLDIQKLSGCHRKEFQHGCGTS